MSMPPLLEPKTITLETQSGQSKDFIISKFPAVSGREIISKYPLSNLPKLGEYAISEETMLLLMSYIAVPVANGDPLRLQTKAVVNNHVPDWETLVKLEAAALEYNCSFFRHGVLPGFIELLVEKATPMLSSILTSSLQALSAANVQPTSNSETS